MKRNKFLEKIFKLRGGIWTTLFLVILLLARPVFLTIMSGLILVVAGQLVRIWASGTIVLYRGEEVKAEKLVTSGPYALMRNPLYFANGLIGAGWSIMAGPVAFFIFLLVFFGLYNLSIIPYEEQFLEDKFGSRYLEYKRNTGRFFPRKFAAKNIRADFNPEVIMKSEIHSLMVTVIGTILLISRIWW